MDDQTLNRLFVIYVLERSTIFCPKEDEVLINKGLISAKGEITETGIEYVQKLDVTSKMKLIDMYWIERTRPHSSDIDNIFIEIQKALTGLIKQSTLEELPIFLSHQEAGIRKIAAEVYRLKKGGLECTGYID